MQGQELLQIVALLNSSAIAGAVGGGLGNLAIQYSYQRFDVGVMISTILMLIGLVQIVQFLVDFLAQRMRKK